MIQYSLAYVTGVVDGRLIAPQRRGSPEEISNAYDGIQHQDWSVVILGISLVASLHALSFWTITNNLQVHPSTDRDMTCRSEWAAHIFKSDQDSDGDSDGITRNGWFRRWREQLLSVRVGEGGVLGLLFMFFFCIVAVFSICHIHCHCPFLCSRSSSINTIRSRTGDKKKHSFTKQPNNLTKKHQNNGQNRTAVMSQGNTNNNAGQHQHTWWGITLQN